MNKKSFVLSLLLVVLVALPMYGQPSSKTPNPLATPDQLAAEQNAAILVNLDAVQQAKAQLAQKWQLFAGSVSQEQAALFQEALDEVTFQIALQIQNMDTNYPKVINILAPPHVSLGQNIPGSRSLFDNPDTIYRVIPISSSAHYVLTGRILPNAPTDINFSLVDSAVNTISNLSGNDLVVDADGNFTITVDSEPANGRVNHIQSTSNATEIFARNTITDWNTQSFTSVSVTRLEAPTAPPRDMNYYAAALAAGLPGMANTYYYFYQRVAQVPVNAMPPIVKGGTGGLLSTQAAEYSRWQIADDEALVVTVNPAGASYITCPVYDKWFLTSDYVNHTQTLNNSQAIPNADGTYTFVIAITDPGVYNWVDTNGLHDGMLNLRWQGLPSMPQNGGPSASTQLVKLDQLQSVLPAGTKYVKPSERKKQLRIRATSFDRRYDDNWVPPLEQLDHLTSVLIDHLQTEPN